MTVTKPTKRDSALKHPAKRTATKTNEKVTKPTKRDSALKPNLHGFSLDNRIGHKTHKARQRIETPSRWSGLRGQEHVTKPTKRDSALTERGDGHLKGDRH
ncbi:MAG: hypothetical protein ACOYZ7_10310, partial [Chloroflexota bacterium]